MTAVDKLKRFVKERDEALLSLDEQKIRAFSKKYEIQMPENETVFWAGVHKAITALKSAPIEQKTASIIWLAEHGFGPGVWGSM